VFRQGVLVAVLNPKTALFFFAFLPQFVDTSGGSATGQLLTMGCLFVGMAMVSDGLYALLAGTAGRWLQGGRKAMRAGRFLAGGVYIGLGVAAALSDTDFH
jgi:threonine/homoserine/homoserine lactone efflux protein